MNIANPTNIRHIQQLVWEMLGIYPSKWQKSRRLLGGIHFAVEGNYKAVIT